MESREISASGECNYKQLTSPTPSATQKKRQTLSTSNKTKTSSTRFATHHPLPKPSFFPFSNIEKALNRHIFYLYSISLKNKENLQLISKKLSHTIENIKKQVFIYEGKLIIEKSSSKNNLSVISALQTEEKNSNQKQAFTKPLTPKNQIAEIKPTLQGEVIDEAKTRILDRYDTNLEKQKRYKDKIDRGQLESIVQEAAERLKEVNLKGKLDFGELISFEKDGKAFKTALKQKDGKIKMMIFQRDDLLAEGSYGAVYNIFKVHTGKSLVGKKNKKLPLTLKDPLNSNQRRKEGDATITPASPTDKEYNRLQQLAPTLKDLTSLSDEERQAYGLDSETVLFANLPKYDLKGQDEIYMEKKKPFNTLDISDPTVRKEVAKKEIAIVSLLLSKQMIHGDLKPDNLLVDDKGRVMASDNVGIKRSEEYHNQKDMDHTAAFTHPFPNQFDELKHLQDVYSLGVMLSELFKPGILKDSRLKNYVPVFDVSLINKEKWLESFPITETVNGLENPNKNRNKLLLKLITLEFESVEKIKKELFEKEEFKLNQKTMLKLTDIAKKRNNSIDKQILSLNQKKEENHIRNLLLHLAYTLEKDDDPRALKFIESLASVEERSKSNLANKTEETKNKLSSLKKENEDLISIIERLKARNQKLEESISKIKKNKFLFKKSKKIKKLEIKIKNNENLSASNISLIYRNINEIEKASPQHSSPLPG